MHKKWGSIIVIIIIGVLGTISPSYMLMHRAVQRFQEFPILLCCQSIDHSSTKQYGAEKKKKGRKWSPIDYHHQHYHLQKAQVQSADLQQ